MLVYPAPVVLHTTEPGMPSTVGVSKLFWNLPPTLATSMHSLNFNTGLVVQCWYSLAETPFQRQKNGAGFVLPACPHRDLRVCGRLLNTFYLKIYFQHKIWPRPYIFLFGSFPHILSRPLLATNTNRSMDSTTNDCSISFKMMIDLFHPRPDIFQSRSNFCRDLCLWTHVHLLTELQHGQSIRRPSLGSVLSHSETWTAMKFYWLNTWDLLNCSQNGTLMQSCQGGRTAGSQNCRVHRTGPGMRGLVTS